MEETQTNFCQGAAVEFIKNRVDDGMEIFPCLEIVTDAIKAGLGSLGYWTGFGIITCEGLWVSM